MNNPQMMPVAIDFGRTDSRWTPPRAPRPKRSAWPRNRVRFAAATRLHRLAERLEAPIPDRPIAC